MQTLSVITHLSRNRDTRSQALDTAQGKGRILGLKNGSCLKRGQSSPRAPKGQQKLSTPSKAHQTTLDLVQDLSNLGIICDFRDALWKEKRVCMSNRVNWESSSICVCWSLFRVALLAVPCGSSDSPQWSAEQDFQTLPGSLTHPSLC